MRRITIFFYIIFVIVVLIIIISIIIIIITIIIIIIIVIIIIINKFSFIYLHIRVPDEFITQRVDVANPPTLILVIENLLNFVEKNKIHDENITGAFGNNNYCIQKDGSINNEFDIPSDYSYIDGTNIENCHDDPYNQTNILIYQFLNEIYPALNEWISWFLDSQKGPSSTIDVEDTEGMTLRYDYLKIVVINLLYVFHLIIVSINQSIFEFNYYCYLNCKKWIHPFLILSVFFFYS